MLNRMMARACAGLLLCAALVAVRPAVAAQGSGCLPTTGTVSGLTMAQDVNAAIAALISSNSGASAPATDCTAVAIKGQLWLDTSAAPNVLKQYDGTSWLPIGSLDLTNHVWMPPLGGGVTTLSSATTTDLWSVANTSITVGGTTIITALASSSAAPGTFKVVKFSGALTLTHNATSLIIPGGANITTAAGDYALVLALTSTNVAVMAYTKADGTALLVPSNFTAAVYYNGAISPSALGGNTNDWNPSGLATANVIRFSCSAAYNITGLTAPATSGQILVLHNIGATNPCTLTSQDANSTAANRFAISYAYPVYPGQSVEVIYDLTTARWRMPSPPVAQQVAGGHKFLRVFNVATPYGDSAPVTPNNMMTIAADAITLEDTSGFSYRAKSVSCTVDITASGAGGLDTSTVATATWYSEWVIYNPTTNAQSCLVSTSATAPTMPSGYTFKARVGWNKTDGSSHFYRLLQSGTLAQYVVGTNPANTQALFIDSGTKGSYSATSPTLTPVSVAGLVPSTASRINIIGGTVFSGGATSSVIVAPTAAWGGANMGPGGSSGNTPPIFWATGSAQNSTTWLILEASTIAWASSASGGFIAALGWDDNL